MAETESLLAVDGIDAPAIVAELAEWGATSRPLLSEPGRRRLLGAARAMAFRSSRPVVGTGEAVVRQELDWSDAFPADSPFHVLAATYQALWDDAIARLPASPFATPLCFNEMMMTRYRAGSIGITPHRDHVSYVNLVALVVLEGEGSFRVAEDRSGTGPRAVPGSPGCVILMRAPGFLGSAVRPFHYVTDIRSTRTVFGLRHESPPGARLTRTRPADG
ncbi:MAG: hypothetical protein WD673_14180 [Alphaproteobacteria bacterium]